MPEIERSRDRMRRDEIMTSMSSCIVNQALLLTNFFLKRKTEKLR